MNQDAKSRIERYQYWDIFADDVDQRSDRKILADIDDLMTNVEEDVTERAEAAGNDPAQTRKKVAGDYSQALVSYATAEPAERSGFRLLHNRDLGATELSGAVPSLGGGDIELSPDADIVYYDPDDETSPIFILSCKTSFRERMAQSGMWKLLFEAARYKCSDPECPTHDYSFRGDFDREIHMGFATADFYDDVEAKDIVDMFDFGYTPSIASSRYDSTVYPLSSLLDHIENRWADFR